MLSFTIGHSTISVFLDGEFFTIDDSHANYQPLLDELKKPSEERDLDSIRSFVTIRRMIEAMSYGRVQIDDAAVYFEGSQVNNYMTQRMLEIIQQGLDIEPWARFMDKVFDNPAAYARDELFQWMEKANMPLTPEGDFLAFKKVRADYTDCHTGKFDNSLGNVLEMERSRCDTNRHNHCSTGFHFASVGYLSNFGGQRVVVVKINPRDVTSIPSDYQFTKGRCCRYEVVAELTQENAAHHGVWRKGIVNLEDPAEFPADVLAKIKLPSPALNEPVVIEADSDPADVETIAAQPEPVIGSIPGVTVVASKSKAGASKVAVKKAANDEEFIFTTSDGRTFNATVIKAALDDASIRGAARNLGIQDSTLRGWKKKLGL